jgi:hypothetical protein
LIRTRRTGPGHRTRLAAGQPEGCVELAQPADQIQHITIAPHPGGEPLEIAQCLFGIAICTLTTYVAVDAIRTRPIRFDCDQIKTFFFNQPAGQFRTRAIELMRTVRGFAQQYQVGIANPFDQRVEIRWCPLQWVSCFPQRIEERRFADHRRSTHTGHRGTARADQERSVHLSSSA